MDFERERVRTCGVRGAGWFEMQMLFTCSGSRGFDGTARIRSRRAVTGARVPSPSLIGAGFCLGILIVLVTTCRLLLSYDPDVGILPVPVSAYEIKARYEIPPPNRGHVLLPGELIRPNRPDYSPASVPALSQHGTVPAAGSRLVMCNASDRPVTGRVGHTSFRLNPGAEVSMLVASGWLDVYAEAPGAVSVPCRVLLSPHRTYVCSFRLVGERAAQFH